MAAYGTITINGTVTDDSAGGAIYFYNGAVNAADYLGSVETATTGPGSDTTGTQVTYYYS